jgi:hypothetical protein
MMTFEGTFTVTTSEVSTESSPRAADSLSMASG